MTAEAPAGEDTVTAHTHATKNHPVQRLLAVGPGSWAINAAASARHPMPMHPHSRHYQLVRCHMAPEPPDPLGLSLLDKWPLRCTNISLLNGKSVIQANMALTSLLTGSQAVAMLQHLHLGLNIGHLHQIYMMAISTKYT